MTRVNRNDSPDFFPEQYRALSAPTPPLELPTAPSRFERLKGMVLQLFSLREQPKTDGQLAGRIRALQDTAHAVLNQLMSIKKELSTLLDNQLITYVEAVVDPMIRDVARLQKMTQSQASLEEQVQAYEKYAHWIEKAKPWVQLFTKHSTDVEAISDAVVQHGLHVVTNLIHRDHQVVDDYLLHQLGKLSLPNTAKEELKQRIAERLEGIFHQLDQLTIPPPNLSLSDLKQWQLRVNAARERLNEQALHIIDKEVHRIQPEAANPVEIDESVVKNFEEMAELEEGAPQLLHEIEEEGGLDLSERLTLHKKLTRLENEALQLERELRLSPELLSRLQRVSKYLNDIHGLLDKDK